MTGELVHLELHTPDRSAARSLYRELLGWRAAPVAGTYAARAHFPGLIVIFTLPLSVVAGSCSAFTIIRQTPPSGLRIR